jgi:hypothetical protein
MSKCACLDMDDQICFELRHFGYSPVAENQESREKCCCVCHYDEDRTGD